MAGKHLGLSRFKATFVVFTRRDFLEDIVYKKSERVRRREESE